MVFVIFFWPSFLSYNICIVPVPTGFIVCSPIFEIFLERNKLLHSCSSNDIVLATIPQEIATDILKKVFNKESPINIIKHDMISLMKYLKKMKKWRCEVHHCSKMLKTILLLECFLHIWMLLAQMYLQQLEIAGLLLGLFHSFTSN